MVQDKTSTKKLSKKELRKKAKKQRLFYLRKIFLLSFQCRYEKLLYRIENYRTLKLKALIERLIISNEHKIKDNGK